MPTLARLQRIVQDVSSAASLDELLRILSEQVKEVMALDVCSIYLMDADQQELVLMCTVGLDPESVGRIRMPLGDGLVGLVGERQQLLNIEDAPAHPNFHYFPEAQEDAYHAFLGAPIVHYRELVGVIVVQQREARRFDGEDEAFLVTIAAHLSATLSQAINSGKLANLLKQGKRAAQQTFVNGSKGAPGIGIGYCHVAGARISFRDVDESVEQNPTKEWSRFEQAVAGVRSELQTGASQMEGCSDDVQAIFEAYRLILEGVDLQSAVRRRIDKGLGAAWALKQAIEELASVFEAMEDAYFRARGEDVRNIGLRLLRFLLEPDAKPVRLDRPCVLIGEVVSVSDIAEIPLDRLAGVVCQHGSALSHTAILAGALGVPAVMGVGELPIRLLSGKKAIVDGHQGRVHFRPNNALLGEFRRLQKQERELDRSLDRLKSEPAVSLDGHHVEMLVNTGLLSDISPGLQRGAEGVGLYRTEIPFMVHETFPTEDEQVGVYRRVLSEFHPRPVTMRTLDVGGDKPLPYFPVVEDNPYLGWRGIRFTLDHPEIFMGQIRAMLRANEGLGNLRILIPMVSSVEEIDGFTRLLDKAINGLREEGVDVEKPPIGAMIEVPSSLYLLDFLAWRLDFVSIGTNDLTQYLLAVDRNNEQVASLFSRLHPSVVRAMAQITRQARENGLHLCVCGELAADPAAVLLMLGMGVKALSMNAYSLPRIKHVIRSVSREQAQGLLVNALRMPSEREIRNMLNRYLEKAGLASLLPADRG